MMSFLSKTVQWLRGQRTAPSPSGDAATNTVPINDAIQNSYELNQPLLLAPMANDRSEQTSVRGTLPAAARPLSVLQPAQPWSLAPQSLARWGWLEAAEFVADVVVTLLPLLFLAFAGIAASLDGKMTRLWHFGVWYENQWGEQVRRAANLGPTVFPIAFAVIVRRMLREGARWRAQRGAPLGALEELLGSASLFGTVETQFLLRSCTFTGVLLFVLWALSPVGGQASLRLVSKKNISAVREDEITYVAKEQAYSLAFVGPVA
jgi:hypothetical protein